MLIVFGSLFSTINLNKSQAVAVCGLTLNIYRLICLVFFLLLEGAMGDRGDSGFSGPLGETGRPGQDGLPGPVGDPGEPVKVFLLEEEVHFLEASYLHCTCKIFHFATLLCSTFQLL